MSGKNGSKDDPALDDKGSGKGGNSSGGNGNSGNGSSGNGGGSGSGNSGDDPLNHDAGDDHGTDDPATHDVGDDHGTDDPATHDVGDDHGTDDPATHDVGDDHGTDDPATHDVGDDHGQHALHVFVDRDTQQVVFTDDSVERARWDSDDSLLALNLPVTVPATSSQTEAVWRFHDPVSDIYFWTIDATLKDDLRSSHPELEFEGEAFQAYRGAEDGGQTAIGLVWDHGFDGAYGRFVYAPVDDAVALAGVSTTDGLEYLGVAFWI